MPALDKLAAVEGGFADPVFDGQAVFRAVMDGLGRPGTIVDLGARVQAPAPLVPAAAAFLAALADQDTAVWMEAGSEAAASWISFHTGAPLVEHPAAAIFGLCAVDTDPALWNRFPIGTADYPDRSATLLLPVRAWSGGPSLVLTGPGIETSRRITPLGLGRSFFEAMATNASLFPCGLDLLLVCGTEAMALPRTTRLRED